MAKYLILVPLLFAFVVFCPSDTCAQMTEFTYQGSLNNGGAPATGDYDFEFALFDALMGGTQLGSTLTRSGVAVANGTFSVSLDFGSQFPGPARFLGIRVRQTGGGAFTLLTPRQKIASSPYAVKSLNADTATNATNATTATNATQLGGIAASQYLQTTGNGSGLTNLNASSVATGVLSNARLGQLPTANIADNAITSPKIATGNVVKGLNGLTDSVILAAGSNITITPAGNTLTIASASGGGGILNQTTQQAGANFNIGGTGTAGIFDATTQYNIDGMRVLSVAGTGNVFVGVGAGAANTGGSSNSFFGRDAGQTNTTGAGNSFFGVTAGRFNTSGHANSFFGTDAGDSNTTGRDNSFFGNDAGNFSTTGDGNSFFGKGAGQSNTTGSNNTLVGDQSDVGSANLSFATAIGAGTVVSSSNRIQLGRQGGLDDVRIPGTLILVNLGAAGATNLCRNASNEISTCSSSLRDKSDVRTFTGGLDIVRRLRPISFNWKQGALRDIGFGAEEVVKVDPLLATYNDKGEIEGVKYDQISVVLVDALKEQQQQIEALQKQIKQQRAWLDAFRAMICAQNATADACRPRE